VNSNVSEKPVASLFMTSILKIEAKVYDETFVSSVDVYDGIILKMKFQNFDPQKNFKS
jgi:hypothetical protein